MSDVKYRGIKRDLKSGNITLKEAIDKAKSRGIVGDFIEELKNIPSMQKIIIEMEEKNDVNLSDLGISDQDEFEDEDEFEEEYVSNSFSVVYSTVVNPAIPNSEIGAEKILGGNAINALPHGFGIDGTEVSDVWWLDGNKLIINIQRIDDVDVDIDSITNDVPKKYGKDVRTEHGVIKNGVIFTLSEVNDD